MSGKTLVVTKLAVRSNLEKSALRNAFYLVIFIFLMVFSPWPVSSSLVNDKWDQWFVFVASPPPSSPQDSTCCVLGVMPGSVYPDHQESGVAALHSNQGV